MVISGHPRGQQPGQPTKPSPPSTGAGLDGDSPAATAAAVGPGPSSWPGWWAAPPPAAAQDRAPPSPALEMNHSRQRHFSDYSFFSFLFFFYEKDHTEFANKQNSKRNLKKKKRENSNSPKKQNQSLAFPSLKIVWTRPPVPLEGAGAGKCSRGRAGGAGAPLSPFLSPFSP